MADGYATTGIEPAPKPSWMWLQIFRCFQVALDPRKLIVAALGILVMSLGWHLLSKAFYHDAPVKPTLTADAAANTESLRNYDRDMAQWRVLDSLAGPGGAIRSMPWNENRGENPYLFLGRVASMPSAAWFDESWRYFKMQLPVMVEPLQKLLLPIVKLTDPNASPLTRLYLVFVLFWSIAVWAFAGGVITRIAAVQLSGKDRVSITDAVKFVCNRYLSYVLSPTVPVGVIGAVVVGLCLLGFVCLVPVLGDVLYALLMPLVLLGGLIMAILLIGLLGYPLMYSTLSTEGSDTFDALSRSYNYVFQAPWSYAWYWAVAIVYGAIVTFFVVLVCSLTVYLGKWAIVQTPLSERTNQKADYLFISTPESFGWRELLLRGTPLQGHVERVFDEKDKTKSRVEYVYSDRDAAKKYEDDYSWYNEFGAALTTVWLTVVFMIMLGFSYSFFWSAACMIYLLMRNKVDEVDLDEVYLEDDDVPPPPPSPVLNTPPAPIAPPTPEKPSTLPMVTPDVTSVTTPEVKALPPDAPKSPEPPKAPEPPKPAN